MRPVNPLVRTEPVPEVERRPGKVWMFTYECAGLAQAGGLGEAVAGLARTLAHDYGLRVTVFLPSHGRHLDPRLKEDYGFTELRTFITSDYRTGVNGVQYGFVSGVERGKRDEIEFVLVKGLDTSTSRWLDDPILYDRDVTFEKMALFARTAKAYSEYLLSTGKHADLPDLIHAHDWHMVPAGVAVKQHLQDRGLSVPLVFTVHLLSRVSLPWHYASEDWCGIKDLTRKFRLGRNRVSRLGTREVWHDLCHDSLERFGCYEADYVTSVSESYLSDDVLGYVGEEIKGKSGHIYNGCDWDPDSIETSVIAQHSELVKPRLAAEHADRWTLRKYLLTSGITHAGSALTREDDIESSVESSDGENPVEAFRTDGPLVLMTGRLSPQKGVDILLDAVPFVTRMIPRTKFLLFLLPSGDSALNERVGKAVEDHPNNLRVIFGRQPSLYMISHLAADVYAMPSRSEPFGISALEAMITGNPVVGTNLGGIRETVLDLAGHGEEGTGVLVPPEDARSLADSLVSLLLLMWIDEQTRRGRHDSIEEARRMPLQFIAKMVTREPGLGSKIRDNCVRRVEQNFRWRNAGEMALERYRTAVKLAASVSRLVEPSRGHRVSARPS